MGNSKRFDSIDLLRGLVMVIMALDHVRDYFHVASFKFSPTDLERTTPAIFFTRWITHYCAPVFVFLAGTSAFMVMKRKGGPYTSRFLLSRGIWLIFLEATFVSFAWNFTIGQGGGFFQVIWAIGFSMVALSLISRLPFPLTLLIGLMLVFGHNLLDPVEFEDGTTQAAIWAALHEGGVIKVGPLFYFIAYPVLPWIGVMTLGYCFGVFYTSERLAERKSQWLWTMGTGAILLFILLRASNIYGDPSPWDSQKDFIHTLMAFLNVEKYPPSLDYLLMTLGPALIFLALADSLKGKVVSMFVTLGRVPLFYYIAHLYLIHALAILNVALFFPKYRWQDMLISDWSQFAEAFQGYGYGLPGTFAVWLVVVALLYFPCKWYGRFKQAHPEKWWLSYL